MTLEKENENNGINLNNSKGVLQLNTLKNRKGEIEMESAAATQKNRNRFTLTKVSQIDSTNINKCGIFVMATFKTKENQTIQRIGILDMATLHILTVKLNGNNYISSHTIAVNLENEAYCARWSYHSPILVVGDVKGMVHFIDDQGTILLSYPLLVVNNERKSPFECIAFSLDCRSSSFSETEELLVASSSGRLIRVSNLPMNQLKEAARTGHGSILKDLKLTTADVGTYHQDGIMDIQSKIFGCHTSIMISGKGEETISQWMALHPFSNVPTRKTKITYMSGLSSLDLNALKIVMSPHSNFFLAIDTDGNLSLWDSIGLLCLRQWNEEYSFKDVSWILNDPITLSDNSLQSVTQIAAITCSPCGATWFLSIYEMSFPNLIQLYCKTISSDSKLLVENNVYLLEWTASSVSIDLVLPVVSLEKKSVNLPHSLRKLKEFFSKPTLIRDQDLNSIKELIQECIFYNSNDIYALLHLCLEAKNLSSDDVTEVLLQLRDCCCKKVLFNETSTSSSSSSNDLVLKEMGKKIENIRWKWTTFQLISDPSEDFVFQKWKTFLFADMKDEVMKYMKKGCIRTVITLWRRHSKDLKSRVIPLLTHLPIELPPQIYVSWIQQEILPYLSSQQTKELASFLIHTSKAKERLDQHPENALLIASVFQNPSNSTWSFSQQHTIAEIREIKELYGQFLDLSRLRNLHQFQLPFDEFVKSSWYEIGIQMLDRVKDPELVEKEIVCHVVPFLRQHNQSLEKLLFDYIEQRTSDNSIEIRTITDERKDIVIIKHMESMEMKSKAALLFLQAVKPPYSSTIQEFANNAIHWNTSHQQQLSELKRLIDLQNMFARYGIKQFNLADYFQAKRLLSHIVSQVNLPNALEDALQLVSAYGTFKRRDVLVEYLENVVSTPPLVYSSSDLSSSRVDRVLEILKTMEDKLEVVFSIVQEVLHYCLMCLELQESKEEFQMFVEAAECLTSFALSLKQEMGSVSSFLVKEELLVQLRHLRRLHLEFNLSLSLQDLKNKTMCKGILIQQVDEQLTCFYQMKAQENNYASGRNQEKNEERNPMPPNTLIDFHQRGKQDQTNPMPLDAMINVHNKYEGKAKQSYVKMMSRLSTLTDLLGFSKDEFCNVVSLSLANAGKMKEVMDYSRDQYYHALPKSTALTLKSTAKAISMYMTRHAVSVDSPGYVIELLGYCCDICEEEDLVEVVDLMGTVQIAKSLLLACQNDEGDSEMIEELRKTLYPTWYRGDVVVLNADSIMKFATQFVLEEYQRRTRGSVGYEATSKLVAYLLENSATQLALSVVASLMITPDHQILHKQSSALLNRMLQSSTIDQELTLGYMLSIDQKDSFELMRKQVYRENSCKDYQRVEQLAALGVYVGKAWNEAGFQQTCTILQQNAKWWKLLTNLGIEYNNKAFKSDCRDMDHIKKLILSLLEKTNLNISKVFEFSRYYEIEDSFTSGLYLKQVLLQSDLLDYQERIKCIQSTIEEPELIEAIESILPKVSSFDYEKLEFCFQLLLQTSNYPHQSKVMCNLEILQLLKAYHSKGGKDHKNRLSFYDLLEDPWKVLNKVLNRETVVKLVALSGPLKMDSDDFYINVIKNTLHPLCKEKKRKVEYSLDDLLPLFSNIRNMQVANEILLWTSDYFAEQDRLKLLEYGMSLHLEDHGELKKRLALTRTESTLSSLGIPELEQHLRQYMDQPMELFSQIYHKSSLLLNSPSLVHSIADEIAKIHDFSAKKCRENLVKQLLLQGTQIETSQDLSIPKKNTEYESKWILEESDQEKQRQLNQEIEATLEILCSYSQYNSDVVTLEETVIFLIRYGYDNHSLKITYRGRQRALNVASRLASPELLEQVSGKDIGHLYRYWQHCHCMIEFEEMHISQNIQDLMQCNKTNLIRGLLKNHKGNRRMLCLVCKLLLDFKIEDHDLWLQTLLTMEKLEMYHFLFYKLEALSFLPFISSLELSSLWTTVLQRPLEEIESCTCSMERVQEVLRQVLLLLHKNPFMDSFEVAKVAKKIIGLGERYHHLAVRCSLGIPNVKLRRKALQLLITSGVYIPVLDEIMAATEFKEDEYHAHDEENSTHGGDDHDDGDFTLVQNVFQAIEDSNAHEKLIPTRYFSSFKEYLVAGGQINKLLKYLLETKQYSLAINFLKMHLGKENLVDDDDDECWKMLQDYVLQTQDIPSNLVETR